MKKTKICHISTYEGGGAGTAAVRLHNGLSAENIDSSFVCAYRTGKNENVDPCSPISNSRWKNVLKRINLYKGVVKKEREAVIRSQGSYDYFSLPFSDYRVETHPKVLEADIIHLHWIADFVNYPSFFETVRKPIVWTFHDMNPFMGGFHYQSDMEKNMNNAEIMNLEERYIKQKTDALSKNKSIEVVTPSRWLYNESSKSKITGAFSHHYIPYGLDTNLFKPIPKDASREIFSLPKDKKIIVFVSERLKNERKGFNLLVKAFSEQQGNYLLIAAGNDYSERLNTENLHVLGPVHDDRLLSVLYSAADVVVIPSVEDNLPNVLLEALVCGTPVIAFSVGGMKDTIKNGENGFLCTQMSSSALGSTIKNYLDNELFDASSIRCDSVKKFSMNVQAIKYIDIYERLLKN